jgi:PTS system nitrogen regulatory IIA component
MDLSVRDVARLLTVSEDTVYRWVRAGTLPAHRVHDQYRFNRVELQEWAAKNKYRISPELFASESSAEGSPLLHAALERGGIFYQVPGHRREEVLEAITQLPAIPPSVNRQLLYQLLVAREALASTGIGEGIAIPHPRDPVVVELDEPHVILGFLDQPVDFRAIDAEPVRMVFLMLSPSVRAHLQMLARLAFALHDQTLKDLLRAPAPKDALLNRFRLVEESFVYQERHSQA